MKLRNKDTGEDGRLMMCHDYDKYPFFIEIGSIKIYYHNFADMVEAGWDCIKIPSEPLIKDEKIRKAVRAWAEACDIESCYLDCGEFCTKHREINCCIGFGESVSEIPLKEKHYTIAELCGEEEEG